jgi:hypothetical protein
LTNTEKWRAPDFDICQVTTLGNFPWNFLSLS